MNFGVWGSRQMVSVQWFQAFGRWWARKNSSQGRMHFGASEAIRSIGLSGDAKVAYLLANWQARPKSSGLFMVLI